MKRLAVPTGVLAVLLACDGGPGDGLVEGTADTGGTVRTDGMGTQVGSEGFWGCPISEVGPLAATEAIPTLGGAPVDLVAPLVGTWTLSIVDPELGTPAEATLVLADAGDYLWVDTDEGAGCVDHLAAEVVGSSARNGKSSAWRGIVAVAEGGARVLVTAEGGPDTLAATWGATSYPETVSATLRLGGDIDAATIAGQVSWVDCDPLEFRCATADPLGEVTGSR